MVWSPQGLTDTHQAAVRSATPERAPEPGPASKAAGAARTPPRAHGHACPAARTAGRAAAPAAPPAPPIPHSPSGGPARQMVAGVHVADDGCCRRHGLLDERLLRPV